VFRRNFMAPGAALLSFSGHLGSQELRRFMVGLKQALGEAYRRQTGRHLAYLTLARFNQQVTSKFHLDGSPDEAYLMLGYEPTEVQSTVAIADYTRAAHDWGIDPKTLLSDLNPMFPGHERRLLPYVTQLERFAPGKAQVLVLNNSSLPYREGGDNFLGVMHQVTIVTPRPDRNRIVNSTMIGAVTAIEEEPLGEDLQRGFVETQGFA